jgi:hypothetical protein
MQRCGQRIAAVAVVRVRPKRKEIDQMKMTIAALMLTAAAATPAIAQTYVQSNGVVSGQVVQTQPLGYQAYAMAPGLDSSEIPNAAWAIDPDPTVRTQLQIQSDITDR